MEANIFHTIGLALNALTIEKILILALLLSNPTFARLFMKNDSKKFDETMKTLTGVIESNNTASTIYREMLTEKVDSAHVKLDKANQNIDSLIKEQAVQSERLKGALRRE